MLHKIKGVVLKLTAYSESSVVVLVFTDKFGIQSYLIYGVKKPKAKIPVNILQPLHLLEMVVYHKTGAQLQRVVEARAVPVFKTIPYDVIKNSTAQFLNEVLHKSIRYQHVDEHLFGFIFHAISWFDEEEKTNVNFHLAFLLKLTRFLGFAPHTEQRIDHQFFDLQEGRFTSVEPTHPYYVAANQANLMMKLLVTPFEQTAGIKMDNHIRRKILENILVYYHLHTASFGQVKSHRVLEKILS